MSNKNSNYDIMMTFFGLPDDNRVRLYLHALKGAYEKNQPIALTADMEQLKSKNFLNSSGSTYGVGSGFSSGFSSGDTIHPEWENFRADLEAAFPVSSNAVNVVRVHSGIAAYGSDKHFIQQVIKAHVVVNGASGDITENPDAWSTAVSVCFCCS